MSINAATQRELAGLEVDARVFLYKIDLNPIGVATTYYFSPHSLNSANVSFGGQVYTYGAVHISEISQDGSGENSRPSLTLRNENNFVSSLCVQYKDLLGAEVTRIKTLKAFLDTQPLANGNNHITRHVFEVSQKKALDEQFGVFELKSMASIEGRKFPKQVCLKNFCTRTYRRWNGTAFVAGTCPYVGGSMFTRDGLATVDPYLDVCSKDLKNGCEKRFPNLTKPTWAMPGMQRVRR